VNGPFSPKVMAAVLVVGLLAFVAFFVANAYDTGPREDLDGGAHAVSKSAVGYAGAVELLKAMGRPVLIARGPVRTSNAKSVLIVSVGSGSLEGVFDAPVVRDFPGRILVVLPKWDTAFDIRRIGWVRKAGLETVVLDDVLEMDPPAPMEEEVEAVEPEPQDRRAQFKARMDRLAKARRGEGEMSFALHRGEARHTLRLSRDEGILDDSAIQTGTIDRFRTFDRIPGWKPMVVDEQGRAVLIADEAQSRRFVLSDPDLINTQGLADLDNAKAFVYLMDNHLDRDASYVFDISMHGFSRSRSFMRQAFEPPFLAATLTALATILLMGWHGFVRFGRAREAGRAFALGKRALADNQADLIKMTGREHRMGSPYAGVVRDLAARAVGAPRDLSSDELDALMDRLGEGGRTSWPFSTLKRDLDLAKDPAELVKAAMSLSHWKSEMTRERQ